MSKKKRQQNQSVVSDETKNNVVSDTQQNSTQPDVTNTHEHGRSMTEMLGVLAVLGVLSIGGVQGYRYAMNKYHSNEVINELNLLNAQLAVFMSGIHDDETVMSLGEPYDNGETINAGGYAFSYGCGQDPASAVPCDLDETGYYMTLSGLPEDVCKSASQMSANMMNLVEQRINGHTDNQGILCQDGDNQLTFLFDADESLFEDGEGEDDGERFETTNPNVANTSTMLATSYTGTYSEGGSCRSNSDCGNGNYCDMTGGVCSNYFDVDESTLIGNCRKASDALQNKPSSAPFWLSSQKMSWWSAKNFCEAIGKRLVTASDYGCDADHCNNMITHDAMVSAYGSNSHAWTNTNYPTGAGHTVIPNIFSISSWLCGGGCDNNTYYAACTDGSWVAPEGTATATNYETTYTQTATGTGTYQNGNCAIKDDYDEVEYAPRYCANRGGVLTLADVGCSIRSQDSTGKSCEQLKGWNGYYLLGNTPPNDSTYQNYDLLTCTSAYMIHESGGTGYVQHYVGITPVEYDYENVNYGTPLCKDDYERGNQAMTTTNYETTTYTQTGTYSQCNCSETWEGKYVDQLQQQCQGRGGLLSLSDLGCKLPQTGVTGIKCNALSGYDGYTVLGNHPAGGTYGYCYAHCDIAFSVYTNDGMITWGGSSNPLCKDDYYQKNQNTTTVAYPTTTNVKRTTDGTTTLPYTGTRTTITTYPATTTTTYPATTTTTNPYTGTRTTVTTYPATTTTTRPATTTTTNPYTGTRTTVTTYPATTTTTRPATTTTTNPYTGTRTTVTTYPATTTTTRPATTTTTNPYTGTRTTVTTHPATTTTTRPATTTTTTNPYTGTRTTVTTRPATTTTTRPATTTTTTNPYTGTRTTVTTHPATTTTTRPATTTTTTNYIITTSK